VNVLKHIDTDAAGAGTLLQQRWASRYVILQKRLIASYKLEEYQPLNDIMQCLPMLEPGRLDRRFLFADENISFVVFCVHLTLALCGQLNQWHNLASDPSWENLVRAYIDYLIHTHQDHAMRQYCLLLVDEARVDVYANFLQGLNADQRQEHLYQLSSLVGRDGMEDLDWAGARRWTQKNVVDIAQRLVEQEMRNDDMSDIALRIKSDAIVGFALAADKLNDSVFPGQALMDANAMLVQFIVDGGRSGSAAAKGLAKELTSQGLVSREAMFFEEATKRPSVVPVSEHDMQQLVDHIRTSAEDAGMQLPALDVGQSLCRVRGDEFMLMAGDRLLAVLCFGGAAEAEQAQEWADALLNCRDRLVAELVFQALEAYVKCDGQFKAWVEHDNVRPDASSANDELRQQWKTQEEDLFGLVQVQFEEALRRLSDRLLPVPPSDELHQQLQRLKCKCIPEMVLLLQRMYLHDAKDADRLQRCMSLANMVASEDLNLHL
jgi:hypothetical protein